MALRKVLPNAADGLAIAEHDEMPPDLDRLQPAPFLCGQEGSAPDQAFDITYLAFHDPATPRRASAEESNCASHRSGIG